MVYSVKNDWKKPREKLLKTLKDTRLCPENKSICQHIFHKGNDANLVTLFINYARQWDLARTGEYIIPSPDITMNAVEMFIKARNEGALWDTTTQYGVWRWELLDFVIAKITEELS